LSGGTRRFGMAAERLLPGVATVRSGSGPGVELRAANGCCASLTGHRKVKIGGLEPGQEQPYG
jgi:hypothetical protein